MILIPVAVDTDVPPEESGRPSRPQTLPLSSGPRTRDGRDGLAGVPNPPRPRPLLHVGPYWYRQRDPLIALASAHPSYRLKSYPEARRLAGGESYKYSRIKDDISLLGYVNGN